MKIKRRHRHKYYTYGCSSCEWDWKNFCSAIELNFNLKHQFGVVVFKTFCRLIKEKKIKLPLIDEAVYSYDPSCLKSFANFDENSYKNPRMRKLRRHRRI